MNKDLVCWVPRVLKPKWTFLFTNLLTNCTHIHLRSVINSSLVPYLLDILTISNILFQWYARLFKQCLFTGVLLFSGIVVQSPLHRFVFFAICFTNNFFFSSPSLSSQETRKTEGEQCAVIIFWSLKLACEVAFLQVVFSCDLPQGGN